MPGESPYDVRLDRDAIERAFPFHFAIRTTSESWGEIVAVGSRLARLLPDVRVGSAFRETFRVSGPGADGVELADPDPSALYILRPVRREDDLRLRGQLVPLAETGVWLFLGAPWIDDLSELQRLGLSLTDFPPHESLGDLLLLMTTRNLALQDQKELAVRLGESNQQLKQELDRRVRLEARLRQGQKMEALGLLAGGVAHDFNNLMTAVLGYATLARESSPEGSPMHRWLTEIEKATHRASALTTQLLTFSRQHVVQPRVVELERECRDAESMLRRLVDDEIELKSDYSPTAIRVRIDPNALHQVIVNLVVNARDAMPVGGTVTLRTRSVGAGEDGPEPPEKGRFGSLLEVVDTGIGMRPEMIERIFEPFFTDRQDRKGTGLGLATVHGVVHQAGGEITVESELDRGTSIRVWFPPCEEEPDPGPEVDIELPHERRLTGTVLLVEDEDAVRELLGQALMATGLKVHLAGDPAEAEGLASQLPELDLLVSDVGLPRQSGPELARRIRELHPGVRLLFISGYAQDEEFRRRVREGEFAFLQKPFRPRELIERIMEIEPPRGPTDGSDRCTG